LLVKDVGFEQHQILVRDPKGMHDRTTMLPETLELSLQTQLQAVKHFHERDLASGDGEVSLPCALAQKYPMLRKNWPGNSFSHLAISHLIHTMGR
jgi:hypothetical protein